MKSPIVWVSVMAATGWLLTTPVNAQTAPSRAPSLAEQPSPAAAGRSPGAVRTPDDIRRSEQPNIGPIVVPSDGASIPFPYTVATEPPREPYRPPVPCAPYARETDGTTTCIGIGRSAPAGRRVVQAVPRAPRVAEERVVRRPPRPAQRIAPELREPTDPRFHPMPADFVAPPPPGGGGFLAFLGGLFSR